MADTEKDPIIEETMQEEAQETCTDTTEEAVQEAQGEEIAEDEEEILDAEYTQAEEDGEENAGLKGFFKKKEKKDKKDAQIEELTDRVRRQMAEFENFRKRTEKEKSAMYEIGAKSVIEKLLPVVDSFERGLAATEAESEDPFVKGMQMTYKQLMSTLDALDVKPIDAAGKEFDPNLHNAVMHVDDDTLGENIVAEELQKGYTYRDSVVRYSMVKVAN